MWNFLKFLNITRSNFCDRGMLAEGVVSKITKDYIKLNGIQFFFRKCFSKEPRFISNSLSFSI